MTLADASYNKPQALNQLDNFYDYEKQFVSIWRDFGRQVLEKNIGEPAKDHQKKKTITTTLGSVSVNNAHAFSSQPFDFRISLLLQELMVYAGTLDCYAKSEEILAKFIHVEVSDVQVWRVSDCYGTEISQQESDKDLQRILPPVSLSDTLYVEADGSMIFSRDEGCKEVKAGRLFKASDYLHPDGKQGFIKQSQYVATLHNSKAFGATMEKLPEDYHVRPSQLVFLTDGATWLKNWIGDAYSESVSILNFYHATEHLHAFCELHFKDKAEGSRWEQVQRDLLLHSEVEAVIDNVAAQGGSKAGQALVEILPEPCRPNGLQALSTDRRWHHWFRCHRISASYRRTEAKEAVGKKRESERSRTHATT